jgi:Type II secretion system (T2SS), protein M subtype b
MRPLNARERKFVAVVILIAAIAGVWLIIVDPVVGGFLDRADERAELADRYARNERLISAVALWRAQAHAQDESAGQYAILAPTEALAVETLKTRIKQFATGGGRVAAVQAIDDRARPGWVRVRADLELTLQQLYAGLKRLEGGVPYVVVDHLTVGADRAFQTGQASPLAVRIEVSAPFRADTRKPEP